MKTPIPSSPKPAPPSSLTMEDVWAEVDGFIPSRQQRPPGSFTGTEYATRSGMPRSTVSERLRKLVAAGKLVPHAGVLPRGGRVTYYTLPPRTHEK